MKKEEHKMNILITGARAPIALEWAYRLNQNGNKIFLADSLSYPIGSFSKDIFKYYKLPKPNKKTSLFINKLIQICIHENIKMLIPTCEEIYYISKFKHLFPPEVILFLDEFEKLSLLHNKFTFIHYIKNIHSHIPITFLIHKKSEYDEWKQNNQINNFIVKPVFSRFGSEVIFNLNKQYPKRFPIVAQEKIIGKEYCTYGIAYQGNLVFYSCYTPKYKAGVGAGIYFEPIVNHKIREFVKKIITELNYTGQIGFDIIENDKGEIYPIECNPRGTSGIHLLLDNSNMIESIFEFKSVENFNYQNPKKIGFAMYLYLFSNLKNYSLREIISDNKTSKDIYESTCNKRLNYYQIISLLEILIRSVKTKFNLRKASTFDIEWDGHEII